MKSALLSQIWSKQPNKIASGSVLVQIQFRFKATAVQSQRAETGPVLMRKNRAEPGGLAGFYLCNRVAFSDRNIHGYHKYTSFQRRRCVLIRSREKTGGGGWGQRSGREKLKKMWGLENKLQRRWKLVSNDAETDSGSDLGPDRAGLLFWRGGSVRRRRRARTDPDSVRPRSVRQETTGGVLRRWGSSSPRRWCPWPEGGCSPPGS